MSNKHNIRVYAASRQAEGSCSVGGCCASKVYVIRAGGSPGDAVFRLCEGHMNTAVDQATQAGFVRRKAREE